MKHHYNIFRAMLVTLLLITYMPFSYANENEDSWEVEIVKVATNETVKSGIVNTNSFSMDGLELNVEYFARVRTKSTFLSDWVVSDNFLIEPMVGIVPTYDYEKGLVLSSGNGQLFILSDRLQTVNIHTVDGCLLHSLPLSAGNTAAVGLAKGLYIVNGQKVIVK